MHEVLAIHEAYRRGDLQALEALLGDPADSPNCRGPAGIGEIILEYAIYHGPLPFIRTLLEQGADLTLGITAASRRRSPRSPPTAPTATRPSSCCLPSAPTFKNAVTATGRCITRSRPTISTAPACCSPTAPTHARTRIDDHATPLEEAEHLGHADAVRLPRELAPG